MRPEVIFLRKGFLRMLDPTNLTCHEAYRTRVKGIWRLQKMCVLIALVLNKMNMYVTPQPRIRNPDSYTNFLAEIYQHTWQSWYFLTWYAGCWGWRSEGKMDQKWLLLLQNSLKQVVPPSLSSALFLVFYCSLCQTYTWTGWEQTEYDFFFFHRSIYFKL